jgi:hypothetical protein
MFEEDLVEDIAFTSQFLLRGFCSGLTKFAQPFVPSFGHLGDEFANERWLNVRTLPPQPPRQIV